MVRERRARGRRAQVLVVVAVLALIAGESRGQYRLVDLGTLGGEYCEATAINESNEVVGHSWTASGEVHAFKWADDVLIDLAPDFTDTRANGINDRGEVVGSIGVQFAVVWRGPAMEVLPDFGGPAVANAINQWGDIVGFSGPGVCCGTTPAVLWRFGQPLTLGTLGGSFAQAVDVNNNGEVVGFSTPAGAGPVRAFVWRNALMQDLGGLIDRRSEARAISASGDVAGLLNSTYPDSPDAYLWSRHENGALRGLESLQGGLALGMNDHGQIVGTAVDEQLRDRAFLWQDGVMIDLNDLVTNAGDWELRQARAINNSGAIIVNGSLLGVSSGRSALLIPDAAPCRSGNVNAGRSTPIDVVFVDRDSGADTNRRVFVRAGEPALLTVLRAIDTRGPRGQWAMWIYGGESFDCAPVRFRSRSGRIATLGETDACLPPENTIAPRRCVPRLADVLGRGPVGVTSKSLGTVTSSMLYLESRSADPSPTEIPVVFPPGTFSIYSVHEDARSPSSPALNVSVGNTIVVESIE